MANDHFKEYVSRKTLVITIILALVFWACFTVLLKAHVPDASDQWRTGWAAYTAACLAGVFFLAEHMFVVVWKETKRLRASAGE